MRATAITLLFLTSVTAIAQAPSSRRVITRGASNASNVEAMVKDSAMRLAEDKKVIDKDIEVLTNLRAADVALTDPMQPSVAVQKAYDHVDKALVLGPDFFVRQGVSRMKQELEAARRSPGTADFGRLRTILQTECVGPASRVVARHGVRLSEETVAWIAAQELIAGHLRQLTETTAEALRAAQY